MVSASHSMKHCNTTVFTQGPAALRIEASFSSPVEDFADAMKTTNLSIYQSLQEN